VFVLEVEEANQAPSKLELAKNKKKKSKKIPILLAVACFFLCVLGALAWEFIINAPEIEALEDGNLADRIKNLTLRNVRQYIVDNEKVGKVFVIEGRVVNEFREPKELIAVEAAIYGKDKQPLAVKKQRCGTQLSLFQLQVLSEKEMESFLNNEVEILTNNINIKQGGEVPFMVLFYSPPAEVSEFGVKIIDVRDAPISR
ncbi:MAG: DUF3426 domain-containing protein, partial [Desulfovibrio sp.]|nr:DUF3426 domain-containing protein [Desulfovibrio sp.]